MPATVTLKNIPDPVYLRLKEAANAHHRSLNSEVIACLERILLPSRVNPEECLARARQLRQGLTAGEFKPEEIAEVIRQGRP